MKKAPSDLTKYQKYYSQETFLQKVGKIALKAGKKVVYLALILYYELTDGSVPIKNKAIIIGALGYLVLPVDLIPDFIPVFGYTYDRAALIAAYMRFRDNVTPQVRSRAGETLNKWFKNVEQQALEQEVENDVDDQTGD